MKERWKTIDGFEAYEVSDLGRVRRRLPGLACGHHGSGPGRAKVGNVLKPCPDTKGYLQLGLQKEGKRTTRKVHRLVAEHFVPNPLGLPEVNHVGNKTDNRAVKLEWISIPEHAADAVRRGQKGKGVYLHKETGKYLAHYTPVTGGKWKYLGLFGTYKKAKAARNRAVGATKGS
jgi:hypothetical protein